MRLELYQAETARVAAAQSALLVQVREILAQGRSLNALEQSGMLHALQVLIENAIGKSKQILKARNEPVPVSAYDAFEVMVRCGEIAQEDLGAWNAVIGLRNRIVHDYMNIDMGKVIEFVRSGKEKLVTEFLRKAMTD